MRALESVMTQRNNHFARSLARFIYEAGMLSKTPRSGLWFLGTGHQTVAEHSLRAILIGFALCHLTPKANRDRVLLLCLFHDFAEGRTSDLNYVHQKYGRLAEAQAMSDLAHTIPFGKEIEGFFEEAKAKKTLEAKLTKDADNLDWIATLREEEVKGNLKAKSWISPALKRLKTPAGRQLGRLLITTHPDEWWFDEKDAWFVDRKKSRRRLGKR